jgi:GTP-binding protein EngB required for normal cell division
MSHPLENGMQNMWYGKLEKLRNTEVMGGDEQGAKFSVPRIVVLGEENNGKSSTLERIAMLKMFPTDSKICTRMPIELRLRYRTEDEIRTKVGDEYVDTGFINISLQPGVNSKNGQSGQGPLKPSEVADKVRTWMEEIVTQQNNSLVGVTDDKLIIELYSCRKLNLDLIDIPGIVGGHIKGESKDMMDQTRKLAESFLNDPENPHTFVVAVVSNKSERVRNSQAMELVQRYGKEDMTVGVLTMIDISADQRNPDDPFALLKERLDGKADDLPQLSLGYVGLKNRDTFKMHDDAHDKLDLANHEEKEWFQLHLPDYSDKKCAGIDGLIRTLVTKLEDYTKTIWAHHEHSRLMQLQESSSDLLGELGEFPYHLSSIIEDTNRFLPSQLPVLDYFEIQNIVANLVDNQEFYTIITNAAGTDLKNVIPIHHSNNGQVNAYQNDGLQLNKKIQFDLKMLSSEKGWSNNMDPQSQGCISFVYTHLPTNDRDKGVLDPTESIMVEGTFCWRCGFQGSQPSALYHSNRMNVPSLLIPSIGTNPSKYLKKVAALKDCILDRVKKALHRILRSPFQNVLAFCKDPKTPSSYLRFTKFHEILHEQLESWLNERKRLVMKSISSWTDDYFSIADKKKSPTADFVSRVGGTAQLEADDDVLCALFTPRPGHHFGSRLSSKIAETIFSSLIYSFSNYIGSNEFRDSILLSYSEKEICSEECSDLRHSLATRINTTREMVKSLEEVFEIKPFSQSWVHTKQKYTDKPPDPPSKQFSLSQNIPSASSPDPPFSFGLNVSGGSSPTTHRSVGFTPPNNSGRFNLKD